jgi:hypothetical protein
MPNVIEAIPNVLPNCTCIVALPTNPHPPKLLNYGELLDSPAPKSTDAVKVRQSSIDSRVTGTVLKRT